MKDEIKPPRVKKRVQDGPCSGFERARAVMGEHYDNFVILAENQDRSFEYFGKSRTWAEGAARRFLRGIDGEDRRD